MRPQLTWTPRVHADGGIGDEPFGILIFGCFQRVTTAAVWLKKDFDGSHCTFAEFNSALRDVESGTIPV